MEKIMAEVQSLNDSNYTRLMAYASKLRGLGKKSEAKVVHNKAQQLNKYFYSAVHTDNSDLVIYYDQKMKSVINEANVLVKEELS